MAKYTKYTQHNKYISRTLPQRYPAYLHYVKNKTYDKIAEEVKKAKAAQVTNKELVDYNDPMQINSVADALFNTDAKVLKYGKWARYLPITSSLVAVAEHSFKHYVKPIFTDEKIIPNLLVDLGETFDIVSRPVKALTTSGGDALEIGRAHV